jgi:deoxyribonuclease-4
MASSKGLLFGTAGIPISAKTRTAEAGIERVQELGLGCMEVEFVHGVKMRPETARAAGELAAERLVNLSAHAPYFVNLNAREPEKVAASRERILQTARMTSVLGGRSIVFHAGYYLGDPPSSAYAAMRENLVQVLAQLREEGNGVTIRPEIMGRVSQFGTLDEVLQLCAEVEGLAPAIDFAHLHARSGRENTYDEFAAILRKVEGALGREVLDDIHIHVSGIEYGTKGERRHLVFADSDFRHADLLRALKDFDVRGLLICESPNLEEDALLLQETYRSL